MHDVIEKREFEVVNTEIRRQGRVRQRALVVQRLNQCRCAPRGILVAPLNGDVPAFLRIGRTLQPLNLNAVFLGLGEVAAHNF
jgi:hypothetical protein